MIKKENGPSWFILSYIDNDFICVARFGPSTYRPYRKDYCQFWIMFKTLGNQPLSAKRRHLSKTCYKLNISKYIFLNTTRLFSTEDLISGKSVGLL